MVLKEASCLASCSTNPYCKRNTRLNTGVVHLFMILFILKLEQLPKGL